MTFPDKRTLRTWLERVMWPPVLVARAVVRVVMRGGEP
jgi:hypothetical protein